METEIPGLKQEIRPEMTLLPLRIRELPPTVRFLGVVLLLQLVLWTIVPSLLYKLLPLDSLEAVAWGSGFTLGNAKHPPLTGWLAGLAVAATGHADWPVYLLSQLCVAGGLVCIYLLAREFFGREESALAALAQEFIIFYNVTTPEFNVNMPLLLLWPMAALFFVRACRRDRIRDWILLGVSAGLCFLCKYFSVLLFATFAAYMLMSKERRRLFLHAGPWIAAASGLLVILPHAMWALTGGLAMMENYVEDRMTVAGEISWFRRHIADVLTILVFSAAAYAIPLGAFFLSKRERPHIPAEPDRREALFFSAVMVGFPLLVLIVLGLFGNAIRAMWVDPLFFPAGILLVSLFPADWTDRQKKTFRLAAILFFGAALTGITVAGLVHTSHRKNFPAKRATVEIAEIYRRETGKDLKAVIGNAWTAGMFRQYAPGHPHGCARKNTCEVERLEPLLREHGGLAVSEKTADIDLILMHFESPDAKRLTLEYEFHSLLGKKKVKKLHLAFLDSGTAK